MDEPKDFLEALEEESKLRFGRELTTQEISAKFLEHKLDARVAHLRNLRKDETLTIHGAAKRLVLERALYDAHHAARRSGR